MKNLILLPFFLFSVLTAFSQDTKTLPIIEIDDNGLAMIQMVNEQEGTKDELFLKGKAWIYETYKSGKSVVEMADKEAGKIIGNARTQELTYKNVGRKMDGGAFTYTIKLDFKDNKYRCSIDNIYYEAGEVLLGEGANYGTDYPSNWPKMGKKYNMKQWNAMKEQALAEFHVILGSLEQAMKKAEDNDDW